MLNFYFLRLGCHDDSHAHHHDCVKTASKLSVLSLVRLEDGGVLATRNGVQAPEIYNVDLHMVSLPLELRSWLSCFGTCAVHLDHGC